MAWSMMKAKQMLAGQGDVHDGAHPQLLIDEEPEKHRLSRHGMGGSLTSRSSGRSGASAMSRQQSQHLSKLEDRSTNNGAPRSEAGSKPNQLFDMRRGMVVVDVIKAVRLGVATDYRLTLRRLKCEARRRL
jgi:hypothetical protein